MYGSLAAGEAAAYSDIEFWLFASAAVFDERAWLDGLGRLFTVVNEFGSHVVVFPGLAGTANVRREFPQVKHCKGGACR